MSSDITRRDLYQAAAHVVYAMRQVERAAIEVAGRQADGPYFEEDADNIAAEMMPSEAKREHPDDDGSWPITDAAGASSFAINWIAKKLGCQPHYVNIREALDALVARASAQTAAGVVEAACNYVKANREAHGHYTNREAAVIKGRVADDALAELEIAVNDYEYTQSLPPADPLRPVQPDSKADSVWHLRDAADTLEFKDEHVHAARLRAIAEKLAEPVQPEPDTVTLPKADAGEVAKALRGGADVLSSICGVTPEAKRQLRANAARLRAIADSLSEQLNGGGR